jgi:hypothetical protein
MDEKFDHLKCCISGSIAQHFVKEPKLMPCGCSACTECIRDYCDTSVNCSKCCGAGFLRNEFVSNQPLKADLIKVMPFLHEEMDKYKESTIESINDEGMKRNGVLRFSFNNIFIQEINKIISNHYDTIRSNAEVRLESIMADIQNQFELFQKRTLEDEAELKEK